MSFELIQKIPEPHLNNLRTISKIILQNNHEVYLVGGSVRDLFMNKIPGEYDLTTSAEPNEIKRMFGKVIETGIKHGTVTILFKNIPYEITTYRIDIGYTDGRRPDQIQFGTSLSEDLKRRDFTMNSLALNISTGEMIDEHNGISDIRNKIIRTIGNPLERFSEDGLRPIRAIRFLSSLGFSIEENTYQAILSTRQITAKISKERFHDELNKILNSINPYAGIHELIKNKIFELFIPQTFEIISTSKLEYLNIITPNILGLRLAYLVKQFGGIPNNYKDKYQFIESILRELKYSKTNIKDALFFSKVFDKSFLLDNISFTQIREILSIFKIHSGGEMLNYLNSYYSYLKINYTDEVIQEFKSKVDKILENKDPLMIGDLKINGNKIIQKFPEIPPTKIGEVLNNCLSSVLINPNMNNEDNLIKFISEILHQEF